MAKQKIVSLYTKDKDGQEAKVNIAESKEGLTSAVAGLQKNISVLSERFKNSLGKQTLAHSVGEIIQSRTPLDVFGYHLLDGSRISAFGDYAGFYKYIEAVYDNAKDETRTIIKRNYTELNDNGWTDLNPGRKDAGSFVDDNGIFRPNLNNYWNILYPYSPTGKDKNKDFTYENTFTIHFNFNTDNNNATQSITDTWYNSSSARCDFFHSYIVSKVLHVDFSSKVNAGAVICNFSYSIDSRQEYDVEAGYDGENYFARIKKPDSDWISFGSYKSTVRIGNRYGFIDTIGAKCTNSLSQRFLGTIDLKKFYIEVDGKEIWRAFEKKVVKCKEGFITEDEYEDLLSESGNCDAFVFNKENRYVRLPFITERHLVSSKKPTPSDATWYNLYSDGWLEQGDMYFTKNTLQSATEQTAKLPLPFNSELYHISINNHNADRGDLCAVIVTKRHKSDFVFALQNDTNYPIEYSACGYVDENYSKGFKSYSYICLANGVDHLVIDKETSTKVSIPFNLFDEKISYFKLNNSCWLLSEGQYNSGYVYKSAYEKLVELYNSKNSEFSIKLKNDTTKNPYDFVLDLEKHEFRLPTKSKVFPDSYDIPDIGDKKQGIRYVVDKKEPTTEDPTWFNLYSDGFLEQGGCIRSTNKSVPVTFPKPFRDTNYTVNLGLNDDDDLSVDKPSWSTKTTTSVQIFNGMTSGLSEGHVPTDWTATGYGVIPENTELLTDVGYFNSSLHLYYYVGETNTNSSVVDVGNLTEELQNAKSKLNYYSDLLDELEAKTDLYSQKLGQKSVNSAIKNIDYTKLYSENMHKLYALPDPTNTGTIIKFRTNVSASSMSRLWRRDIDHDIQMSYGKDHGAGCYGPLTIIDEYGRTLYLQCIAYADDYVEGGSDYHSLYSSDGHLSSPRVGIANYSFDVYFTYDKSKASTSQVQELEKNNIPAYDVKAKLIVDDYQRDNANGLRYYNNYFTGWGWYTSDSSQGTAIQYLFNCINNSSFADSLNNLTLTFSDVRIKKITFNIQRFDGRNTNRREAGGYYSRYVDTYDFSIETKYGVQAKHYDKSNYVDVGDTLVVLDLSEATNKNTNYTSRVVSLYELNSRYNTLNSKIDSNVNTINTTITNNINTLNTKIDNNVKTLQEKDTNLQNQIDSLDSKYNNKINDLKTIVDDSFRVKVISDEIAENLELGTEKYDENTLYLVDPTYEQEEMQEKAKNKFINDRINEALK